VEALAQLGLRLLQGGLGNLAAYLAAHVLLCLVPAFFIAGAMTALIPKETITRFLGRNTPRFISYPAAALAGSLLAVCSCTIVPLFAGIYRKGAGLGPAITFLFFAPAANILALVYTGAVIGADLALARLTLSLSFGIGIGMIMALIFRGADEAHDKATDDPFASLRSSGMRRPALAFLLILVALLLAGTLKVGLLTSPVASVDLRAGDATGLQAALDRLIPFDPGRGEEGLSLQGAVLIPLLGVLGAAGWKGFERIHAGFNRWTWIALALAGVTLVVASLGFQPTASGVTVLFTGKTLGVLAALTALFLIGRAHLTSEDMRDWLWESWRFVRQIFPLLVVGVTVVGMLRVLIRPEWIESLAGRNTLPGALAGVAFGVFMYFPTLVEVPIANLFLGLGMHRGPLLAYLMADPELSLQSILIVSTIIGRRKAWAYVGWVALFSTLAGLTYGAWVDGAGLGWIGVYLTAFLAALAGVLWLAGRHRQADRAGAVPAG
jgi:uncharacterized membrane protein YraQ (UPF0718 family)